MSDGYEFTDSVESTSRDNSNRDFLERTTPVPFSVVLHRPEGKSVPEVFIPKALSEDYLVGIYQERVNTEIVQRDTILFNPTTGLSLKAYGWVSPYSGINYSCIKYECDFFNRFLVIQGNTDSRTVAIEV